MRCFFVRGDGERCVGALTALASGKEENGCLSQFKNENGSTAEGGERGPAAELNAAAERHFSFTVPIVVQNGVSDLFHAASSTNSGWSGVAHFFDVQIDGRRRGRDQPSLKRIT